MGSCAFSILSRWYISRKNHGSLGFVFEAQSGAFGRHHGVERGNGPGSHGSTGGWPVTWPRWHQNDQEFFRKHVTKREEKKQIPGNFWSFFFLFRPCENISSHFTCWGGFPALEGPITFTLLGEGGCHPIYPRVTKDSIEIPCACNDHRW